jgi:hypothetical protein
MKREPALAPIDCREVRRRLSARHDGEAPVATAAEASHLGGCAGCRAFSVRVTTLSRLLDPLRDLPQPPPLAALAEPLRRSGASTLAPSYGPRSLARLAAGLLAFLAVTALARQRTSPVELPADRFITPLVRGLDLREDLIARPEWALLVVLNNRSETPR